MAIETDQQLKNEALDRVGGDLQAIQDYVVRDFARRRAPELVARVIGQFRDAGCNAR